MDIAFVPPLVGVLGAGVALVIYQRVKARPAGAGRALEIAQAIHDGAMVFLRRENTLLAPVALLVAALLAAFLDVGTALSFVTGAVCSMLAAYAGMGMATRANVRTAHAAQTQGVATALSVAFYGGSVMGISVAALGLLGLGTLFVVFGADNTAVTSIQGFGMGASFVALFARVGGGIYTKSADVGADLVGKVEKGIPEDDPRNPGVIADNVGDNVGDIAGMGADIFESYCGAIIGALALAASAARGAAALGASEALLLLPLTLAALGLVSSLIGVALVGLFAAQPPARALRIGTLGTTVLFIAGAYVLVNALGVSAAAWGCVFAGAVGGMVIGLITERYTGGRTVQRIAQSGQTGPATVLIRGLAVGMHSVLIPVLSICAILLITAKLGGLYGVAIAAVGMLATVGMIMAIDAYGPIADNAGGIAEMAGLGAETRRITDGLDELGNTTAAIGKGFAIGSAALTALALMAAYAQVVGAHAADFSLALDRADVLAGLLIGGIFPFTVAALTMTAVGTAAGDIVKEIRRQFHEIPGLMEGTGRPDPDRCIDIATRAALRGMALPGALAVVAPLLVGFGLGPSALGGMLAGATITGVMLALTMANAGGAWDNAKKFVEKGNLGGKGSDVHAACVVGDTVGDPFKDTSGPAMNILIKLMAIVSLVIAPLLG